MGNLRIQNNTGQPPFGGSPVGTHILHCKQSSFEDLIPKLGSCGQGAEGRVKFPGLFSVPNEKFLGSGCGFLHLLFPVGGRAYGTEPNRWHFGFRVPASNRVVPCRTPLPSIMTFIRGYANTWGDRKTEELCDTFEVAGWPLFKKGESQPSP